jgi:protein-S-isoprenylcysteine O-methyltransferase Ste14
MSTGHVRNNSYVLGQNVAIVSYSPGRAQKNHKLATTGPYAYVRCPQYGAFVLVMLGFLVQWPTILTLIMFPILVWVYKKLARREERDTLAEFGEEYSRYMAKIPGFIPRFG